MGSRCVAKHFRRIVPTLEQHLRRPFRKGQGTGEGHLVSGVPFQRGATEPSRGERGMKYITFF